MLTSLFSLFTLLVSVTSFYTENEPSFDYKVITRILHFFLLCRLRLLLFKPHLARKKVNPVPFEPRYFELSGETKNISKLTKRQIQGK